jgi:hypothetical protein
MLVWETNTCMALAIDTNSLAWASTWGADAWGSHEPTINACRKFGGTDCQIAARVCKPSNPRQLPYIYFSHNNGE